MHWKLIIAILLVAIATNGCYGNEDSSRDNSEVSSGGEDDSSKELRILLKRILEGSTSEGSSRQDEDSPPLTRNDDSGSNDDCIGLSCFGAKKRGCTGEACWDDENAKRGSDGTSGEGDVSGAASEDVKTDKSSTTNEDTPPTTGNDDGDNDCIGLSCFGVKKRGCTGKACWDDENAKRSEDVATTSDEGSKTEEGKAEAELKKVAEAGCVSQCQAGCMYSYVDALAGPLNEGEDCEYRKTSAKDDFNGCLKSCDATEESTDITLTVEQEKRGGRYGSSSAQDATERTCLNECRKAYKKIMKDKKNRQKFSRKSARTTFSTCAANCVD